MIIRVKNPFLKDGTIYFVDGYPEPFVKEYKVISITNIEPGNSLCITINNLDEPILNIHYAYINKHDWCRYYADKRTAYYIYDINIKAKNMELNKI
jgi:hypothetical protein